MHPPDLRSPRQTFWASQSVSWRVLDRRGHHFISFKRKCLSFKTIVIIILFFLFTGVICFVRITLIEGIQVILFNKSLKRQIRCEGPIRLPPSWTNNIGIYVGVGWMISLQLVVLSTNFDRKDLIANLFEPPNFLYWWGSPRVISSCLLRWVWGTRKSKDVPTPHSQ